MATAIKNVIIAIFTSFFAKWVEDFLILTGVWLIVVNTYLITVIEKNILAGNYLTGSTLLLIGIILAKR